MAGVVGNGSVVLGTRGGWTVKGKAETKRDAESGRIGFLTAGDLSLSLG